MARCDCLGRFLGKEGIAWLYIELTIPFLPNRLLGLTSSKIVYVESIARVYRLSLSGKILYHSRMAHLFIVQVCVPLGFVKAWGVVTVVSFGSSILQHALATGRACDFPAVPPDAVGRAQSKVSAEHLCRSPHVARK